MKYYIRKKNENTPEDLVNEVVAKLQPDDIEIMKGPKEDFVFVMPPELR